MAGTTTEGLKTKLAPRPENGVAPKGGKTIFDLIEEMKPQLARALPKHMTAERMIRIALTCVRTTPHLADCTADSLRAAIMLSAQLGLEPGPLGHCYLVPFFNSKIGKYECQWILGYKGMIDLLWRSDRLLSISVNEVCEKDFFEFEYGLAPKLVHRPADGDRGRVVKYYGVMHFKGGGHYFTVMSLADIAKFRARSKAADRGPWVTDEVAMSKKTVVRQMARFGPMSVEIQAALAHDEGVHSTFSENVIDEPPTYDTTAVESEAEEPEAPGEPPSEAPAGNLTELLGGK